MLCIRIRLLTLFLLLVDMVFIAIAIVIGKMDGKIMFGRCGGCFAMKQTLMDSEWHDSLQRRVKRVAHCLHPGNLRCNLKKPPIFARQII